MDAIKRLGLSCACAGLYYLAFRFAWFHSADQFFLPAGLRVACLLFLPYRLWPSVFLGDAAAMLSLRIPFAEAHGYPMEWAYGSAILFSPMLALGPLALRRLWPVGFAVGRHLPFTMIGLSVWGVAANIALNAVFSGPIEPALASYFYKVSAGQYLTSLIAVLPVLLWLRRASFNGWTVLTRDAVLCVVALVSAHLGTELVTEQWQRLVLLGMMILPALAMTVLHGWRGAAIGVVAVNLSLGLSIPSTGIFGNRDLVVFVAQQTLAVMGTVLLIAGATISKELERNRSIASREQRLLARAEYLYAEQSLRDRAEAIAEAQQRISGAYRETVRRLREGGHYALAMHINAESMASTRIFYQQASDLYPFQLEAGGLYSVLRSPEFASKLAGGSVEFRLSGPVDSIGLPLQLAAYRCVCHAVEMMPCAAYRISAKSGCTENGRWIVVVVVAASKTNAIRTKSSRMAQVQLNAKLQAYSGRYKFERRKVSILLTDLDQGLRTGTTIQESLSVPLTTLTTNSSEL